MSIQDDYPDLANEAFGWDPSLYSSGSSKSLAWRCAKGHIWNASIGNRTRGTGCPFCKNQKVWPGFNDLATLHPKLAKEAFGWDPKTCLAGSSKKLFWKCKSGHTWEAVVYSRTREKANNCPVCSGQKLVQGVNDLLTTDPLLAVQAFGWDPSTISRGSPRSLEWRCDVGHVYRATVFSRAVKKSNCPVCMGRKVLSGFNDLKTKFPEIAKEAYGWNPAVILSGSKTKKQWKCSIGHLFVSSIANRTSELRKTGCPTCAGLVVLPGFNDLATKNPKVAAQAFGWDPTTVTSGSAKRLAWKCDKGHTWVIAVSTRVGGGSNCPVCSNHLLVSGQNDLKTIRPDLAEQAFGWDPTLVIAGGAKKLKWKCDQGHVWIAQVGLRVSGSGCPSCARFGYDINKPGYLYLLAHSEWGLTQVGITNNLERRLKEHFRLGWSLVDRLGPFDGARANNLETEMLRFLKIGGAQFDAAKRVGKFSGYTESWVTETFKIRKLSVLIAKTEAWSKRAKARDKGGRALA